MANSNQVSVESRNESQRDSLQRLGSQPVSGASDAEKPAARSGAGGGTLRLRLTMPGCHNFYWHCHKQKKMPVIDAEKEEFIRSLWPNRGLMFMTSCDIERAARRIRGAGNTDVECGTYVIVAYWGGGGAEQGDEDGEAKSRAGLATVPDQRPGEQPKT